MLDQVLAALRHPVRRDILDLLLECHADEGGGLCITQVARSLELDRFATSRHLAVLDSAGLVQVENISTARIHSISLEGLSDLDAWLLPHLERLDLRTATDQHTP